MNLTDIINNGRAPSENDMNGNDSIVIDKPDQRSALDQDYDRTKVIDKTTGKNICTIL